jgi:hypothetical protein
MVGAPLETIVGSPTRRDEAKKALQELQALAQATKPSINLAKFIRYCTDAKDLLYRCYEFIGNWSDF